MSHRSSNDGGREAAEPPPAPPLPPQPSSAQAAAIAIARFAQNINYGGAPATTVTPNRLRNLPVAGLTLQKPSRLDFNFSSSYESLLEDPSLGPPWKAPMVPPEIDNSIADRSPSSVPSRDVSHKTGIAISSLDISPCRTRAILAGRDILKTLAVTGSSCVEDHNLGERAVRYAATHGTLRYRDLAANDVKWSHGDFHTTIATAAANGHIVLYDLNRAEVELARLKEHSRQVHRLGFNPHRGNLLLSGSQDATTRLWDLRALAGERSVMTCRSKSKYEGNNEGVRDLRWSPTNGVEFATGTDNGVLQRWDIRKENSPTLKVNAHEKTCNSIDWHPDGKHLVSGSSDKRAKVWDFSSSDRRMKPLWELRVPQAAVHVRWRPVGSSLEDQRPGPWDCTQLAVSYDKEDPRVQIWDLRRPYIPFRVLSRHEISATALLWHSEDLLWSVDSAGVFRQNDVRFAAQPVDGYNLNPIGIAPDGQALFASMQRERSRLSLENVTDSLLNIGRRETSKSARASEGHNSTSGSHEEPSLLHSSLKNRRNKAPNSSKPTRSMDSTSPSAGPSGQPEDTIRPLEISLHHQNMPNAPQILATGSLTDFLDMPGWEFLARHYLPPPQLSAGEGSFDLHTAIIKTFNFNAGVAEKANKQSLAQTWRVLAIIAGKELRERAERNYQLRMTAAATSGEAHEQTTNSLVPQAATEPTRIDKTHIRLSSIFATPSKEPSNVAPAPQDVPPTENHEYIESDFRKTDYDIEQAPHLPRWTATFYIPHLIEDDCAPAGDSQLPAYLIVHLGPWLHFGMDRSRELQIVSTYHQQLMDFELYTQAAELRMYCEDHFPEVTSLVSEEDDKVGPWCTNCHKPSKGRQEKFCERCNEAWAPCSICHDLGPILGEPTGDPELDELYNPHTNDALWAWCVFCGHGGHTGCMRAFWKFSGEGACAVLGCNCDCIPGERREEVYAGLEKGEGKKKEVVQGGAVGATESRVRGGILRGGSGKGDKKKVSFAEGGEERGG